mmetsp:Transcript_35704/g.85251  ORF Transcript_35704/g.85251 Transcript_35704/m.85251 type:complete len:200 (-) Transcript_35704:36-635(-)
MRSPSSSTYSTSSAVAVGELGAVTVATITSSESFTTFLEALRPTLSGPCAASRAPRDVASCGGRAAASAEGPTSTEAPLRPLGFREGERGGRPGGLGVRASAALDSTGAEASAAEVPASSARTPPHVGGSSGSSPSLTSCSSASTSASMPCSCPKLPPPQAPRSARSAPRRRRSPAATTACTATSAQAALSSPMSLPPV